MNELVILDLDGVILREQSQLIFLKYLSKNKIIGLFFYFKIYFWFILYKLGLVKNPKKIMDFAFSFLKGKKVEDVEKIVEIFFTEKLREFIFPEITDIIKEHKARGMELLIISNAIDVIVGRVAEFLGIKNYICTQLEKTNGIFTGKILGNIVYGKNKVILAKEFILKNNLNLSNSYTYTDHISDLDLLLMVSNPNAVNPDRFLLSEAKKRNWPVLIFKK